MPQSVARIGLIGAECTGKSSLADALGVVLPACVVAEELRAFVAARGRPPRIDEQAGIMAAQQAAEDLVAAACEHSVLVADPAPLMTAVYSLAYFDDDSLLAPAVDLAGGYELLVWCDVDVPWEPDPGQRDGPEFRDMVHALLASIVRDRLEPTGPPVILVCGPVAQRVAAVQRAWQPRGLCAPT